ncbi:lysophospholipid acyltransferase family protein [Tenacibaculum sp. UWU-22]|uniref:lysophospholipid acyltransferase family protein n=1 Tax=Tenacibaculum sp. UWU-22 TaxID=3234187 RepID=UPI0034DB6545
MQFLSYIIVYPLIWLISILPFRILYGLSDLFFILLYYVIGYRKKVVYANLKLAFPEKSEEELKKLTKKTLHHFTDFIFESIKTFTISKNAIKKRYKYKNIEVLTALEKENRGVIFTGIHYANWEWVIYLAQLTTLLPVGVYTKVENKYYEKMIKSSRTKFGAVLRRTSDTIKGIITDKKNKINGLYFMLSDQSPQLDKAKYWTTFFGVEVPVIVGPEMLAKKHNFIVVNFTVFRVKRGFYEVELETITTEPKKFNDFEITDIYLKKAEEHIRKQPEFYLWTHKRFKHKDKKPQQL